MPTYTVSIVIRQVAAREPEGVIKCAPLTVSNKGVITVVLSNQAALRIVQRIALVNFPRRVRYRKIVLTGDKLFGIVALMKAVMIEI